MVYIPSSRLVIPRFFKSQLHQQDMLMLVMVDTDMDDVVTAVVAEGHFINQHLGFSRGQFPVFGPLTLG